jgi:hypothetical protein
MTKGYLVPLGDILRSCLKFWVVIVASALLEVAHSSSVLSLSTIEVIMDRRYSIQLPNLTWANLNISTAFELYLC